MNHSSLYRSFRVAGLVLATTLLWTGVASADEVDWEATAQLNLMTSSTSTSSTSIFAAWAIIDPMFSTTTKVTDTISSSTNRLLAPFAMTEQYVRHNQVALQQDITVGAGQTINDLAALCGVSGDEVKPFGRALRAHRAAILKQINGQALEREQIVAFIKEIARAMNSDEALRAHLSPAVIAAL